MDACVPQRRWRSADTGAVRSRRGIRESSCEAVRAALDKRGWLCGLSLAVPIARE
jgi:hypothetical protein